MVKRLLVLLLLIASIASCKKDRKLDTVISSIDMDVNVERFDRIFAESKPDDLPSLKQDFPFLFSSRYPDSLWINRMTDTLQQQLYSEVDTEFKNFDATKQEIKLLFQHLKYYFPEFKKPRVITVTSNVDYRNKVIVTDSIVLISLDTYLGDDHKFYDGIQNYLKQNFNKVQVTPDLATEYAKKYSYQPEKKTLLDEMVYFGKLLYFKDAVLPNKTEAEKIGYTQEQLDWAMANESEIWRYFIERELLYSTDSKLPGRFINPAPFSKFYLELDNESPGRIGQYIGWQIVRSYMQNNNVDLGKMMIASSDEIFKNSKFKPRK